MPIFSIGTTELDLQVVGAGVLNGYLPPPERPLSWDLNADELRDLEAFEAVGWRFQSQTDLDWRTAMKRSDGPFEAGLLARQPWGALVILRDHLVVTAPTGVDWSPAPGPEFREVRSLPLAPNVYDVSLALPESDLLGTIISRIKEIHGVAPDGVRAEPLLVQHFVHRGILAQITVDPTYQWHWDKIDLVGAWSIGSKGLQVTNNNLPIRVAVIDFGFYLQEPQLAGRIAWRAYVDDSGNYYIDTVMPPPDAHGTFCAGIIGALLDNDTVNGAAPDCKLIVLAIQSVTTQLALTTAIHLCATGNGKNDPADIISASIGASISTDGSDTGSIMTKDLQNAIDTVQATGRRKLGVPLVWADFDTNAQIAPGSFEDYGPMILVGQSDQSDKHVMCGYGPSLDLLAPGSAVWGIDWTGGSSALGAESGASVSAPIVAGVAALILANHPNLPYQKVADALTKNCDPAKGQTKPRDDYNGYGRVNAAKSV